MTHADILGWCDFEDAYREAVDHFGRGIFVEVGCYLGRSLAYLGRLVKDTRLPIRVVGVDWCRGSGWENDRDNHADALVDGSLAGPLHANLLKCGVAEVVDLLVAESARAADLFPDSSLDFVYLDAGHSYEQVSRDIVAWRPKVRPGGWLAGDDYCAIWPGVVNAVRHLLPDAEPWSHDSWRYKVPE